MFKNIKFRNSLLTVLIGLLILGILSIMYVNTYYSKKSVNNLVVTLIDKAISNLEAEAKAHFSSSTQLLYRVEKMGKQGLFEKQDQTWIKKFLFSSITAKDNYEALFFANKKGDFYMAKKMLDSTVSVKMMDKSEQKVETKWYHENEEHYKEFKDEIVELQDIQFNPLQRPWYKKAIKSEGIVSTEVYSFFMDKKPGITKAVKIRDIGSDDEVVLGVDIGLASVSKFLSKEKISKNSKMYVLDGKNNIIASLNTQNKTLPYSLENSKDALLQSSIKHSQSASFKNMSVLKFQNEEYINSVTLGSGKFGFVWKMVIIVPKSDFLADVHKNQITSLAIAILVTIILLIIGTIFANKISLSLAEVSYQMKKIEKFDLSDQKEIKSSILEVINIVEALGSMKAGLKSFSKYVPSNLVRQLIELKQEASLGGDKKRVSIFFSDIQNFTNISEKILPEKLVIDLAEYFTVYSNIIIENKGTIDKYIGDSIMAFWGAPKELEHHELLVCKAAIECKTQEKKLMEKWKKYDKLLFISRIGIHTGEVIVGNMGSQNRLNYSIIGDNTNLASRLEGLNKHYGTEIIISESTYQAVKDEVNVRFLDLVTVKGKTQAIKIYELLSLKEHLSSQDEKLIDMSSSAHALYFDRQWSSAIERYEEIETEFDDYMARIFIDRCNAFLQKEPELNWNGVHTLHCK